MHHSVVDNDGEFLLIEAANHLPNWLKPETAIHRVWITPPLGALHIIPSKLVPHLGTTHKQAIETALKTIHSSPSDTIATQKVQNCLQKRISATLASNVPQWSSCTVPVKVAHLLKHHPEYVANAVTAFYHRDPLSLRSAQNFPRFGSGPKVNTMVRFTRCLYAQAASQHWRPPKTYGEANVDEKMAKLVGTVAFDIGAKVAVGFELFYHQDLEKRNKIAAKQAFGMFPWTKDEAWLSYVSKLKTIGYFRGLPETHIKFQELERKAKEKFLSLNPGKAAAVLPKSVTSEIDELLRDFESDPSKSSEVPNTSSSLESRLGSLVAMFPDSSLFPSTSTAWMNISPEEVDRILQERQMETDAYLKATSSKAKDTNGDESSEKGIPSVGDQEMGDEEAMRMAPDIFEKMVKDVESFLSMNSGLDGVDLSEGLGAKGGVGDEGSNLKSKSALFAETGDFEEDSEDEGDDFYGNESDEDHPDLEDVEDWESGAQNLGDVDESALRAERTAMLDLMREMDSELLDTELGKSFSNRNEDDDDTDVDTNLNLVKNFIESYASQHGVAGPVSTLLSQLSDWRKREAEAQEEDE